MEILHVVGARPNFMKAAPLVRAISKYEIFLQKIVHTGQHYDVSMSDVFFQNFEMGEPDVNLGVGSGSHARQTAEILKRLEDVLCKEKPDIVIVYGDVNSTLSGALVCAKMQVPVAHVEAGLRSYDRTMPEEINRIVTDALADLLFTPSADADKNLLREGVPEGKIYLVGNIMIDTLVANLECAMERGCYRKMGLEKNDFIYVTLHRPINVDDRERLEEILLLLNKISKSIPVVFPVHPRTARRIREYGLDKFYQLSGGSTLFLLKPLSYVESLSFLANCRLAITDSGGIQEETTYLHIPCLTLRPNTERPVTIRLGSNRLSTLECLEEEIQQLLNGTNCEFSVPPLWDGRTADRIAQVLVERI